MNSECDDLEEVSSAKQAGQLQLLTEQLPKQYEVLGKISQGGMGAIFKARNRYTGALYAIKVLRPDYTEDEKALHRFVNEAKSASSLKHPNICQVHDFGLTDGSMPFLIMDWIDGISLGKKIDRDGPLAVPEAVRLFQQVAAALTHAHQHKVVHRDLKPDNIMLSRDPEGRTVTHLVDFGIAKVLRDDQSTSQSLALTTTGSVVGTPLYMSPEQARLSKVDFRTDIYSLGCVMYFALNGEPPFVGASPMDTIAKHFFEPPPPMNPALKIPAGLKLVVLKAMEKDPDDRYQTIDQLATDLKKLTKGVSIDQRPLFSQRQSARRRLVIIACFVVGFIITYAISMGLQNLLDSSSSSNKHTSDHTATKTR